MIKRKSEVNYQFLSNLARKFGPSEPATIEGDPAEYAIKPSFRIGDETFSFRGVGWKRGMAEAGIVEGIDEEPGRGNTGKCNPFKSSLPDTLGIFMAFASNIAVDTRTPLEEEVLEASNLVSAICVVLMSGIGSDLPFAIIVKLEESFIESLSSSNSSRSLHEKDTTN